ncbi:MAG TPA: substrate-binding domain-containing protein [Acidimicrobiales bacterium]|nr:substrate-binding domain-containing protein [Acidimicrobiales bacterium]
MKISRLGGLSIVLAVALTGATASVAGASSAKGPTSLSAMSFTNNFSVMKKLKSLAEAGKGKVAAILPDTVSSTRYVESDAPDITKALRAAGLKSSQYVVQNALGSDVTELMDAKTDITRGATVLLIDPLNSGVGVSIESYAKAHGVDVVDYDRLTFGGSREYYVSFNNLAVGKLIGQGLVSCVAEWHVSKPQVVVMHGAATDNKATLFARGYDAVIDPLFHNGSWVDVANTADTSDPPTAESEFQEAYTAHPNINAALIPNDETGAPIIKYLQTLHLAPRTFPTTGQDATLAGLDNVLAGYQCGTVYKPIYLEAEAASALALYLRAGQKPPSNLVNGTTADTSTGTAVKSVLLEPEWVTAANIAKTIIKDNFVPASKLCAGSFASDCTTAGITP